MKVASLILGASLLAACRGKAAPPVTPSDGAAPVTSVTPAIPTQLAGRYALAAATQTVALDGARVFVTIGADGATRVGTLATDALDGGVLVGMPRQVEAADDDTAAGTPRLRATVAGLLGADLPPRVLDDAGREEVRTSGCTHVTGPRAVSWGYSKDQRFEVLAFARAGTAPTARTVLIADGSAPAIRLIQAADDSPDALIAVAGGRGAAALAVHVGGAVALGDPICIAANRSVDIDAGTITVRGDGLDHDRFGSVTVTDGTFDRAALVAAYRAALAANQLGPDDKPVIHVDHTISVATLVTVIDAIVEAG